ncbi:hypothetical protein [Vibrio vulnificus YJ016]|uniref:Uncharacterized protein n=1 Tax=Vibrio vulnificus (strain YJ016) TaxID=196600 RepID=Q7MND2_VIBVY|nr:hypothetical protein [Vibrio vulnificus YJ016]
MFDDSINHRTEEQGADPPNNKVVDRVKMGDLMQMFEGKVSQ